MGSSGLDTLLTALRRVIEEHGSESFPVDRIHEQMTRRGKTLVFEEEEIEELVDMQVGNRMTFALLSLLFPFVDMRYQFHLDHVFPSARLTERQLQRAGVPDDRISEFTLRKNGLANLQLLDGAENAEKSASMPADWLTRSFPDPASRRDYQDRHLLGDVPASITEFVEFYDARRERLKEQITHLLGS